MPDDESQLLDHARHGREAAFLTLYHRYRDSVYRFAWRLTGSAEAAEDVTQDCFMNVLTGTSFDASLGTFRAYLLGTARHIAFRRLRRDGREFPDVDAVPEAASADDALAGMLHQERADAIARAVSLLPPLQREAVLLFEFEDLSLEEIAQIAGVDIGAVKSRLHRARETLRRRLAPLLTPSSERTCS